MVRRRAILVRDIQLLVTFIQAELAAREVPPPSIRDGEVGDPREHRVVDTVSYRAPRGGVEGQ